MYTLWIPYKFPSLNEVIDQNRRNKHLGAVMKRNLTLVVKTYAQEKFTALNDGPYRWRFTWYEENRTRDPDNIASACKFVFDGLQAAGVIPGDGWRVVGEIHHAFEIGEPGVLVEAFETHSAAHACAIASEPVLARDWTDDEWDEL